MAKKKTSAELREEAKRLLRLADELERKERMERAEKVYRAVMDYLKQNPSAEVIPVSILKEEAQG
jgi:hypothetical protein